MNTDKTKNNKEDNTILDDAEVVASATKMMDRFDEAFKELAK